MVILDFIYDHLGLDQFTSLIRIDIYNNRNYFSIGFKITRSTSISY